MIRRLVSLSCLLVILALPNSLPAQGVIFGGTYDPALNEPLAPGQVTTIYIPGHSVPNHRTLRPAHGSTASQLGPFRVTLDPGPDGSGRMGVPVPLFAAFSLPTCPAQLALSSCRSGSVLGLTIQVPYELPAPDSDGAAGGQVPAFTQSLSVLRVWENDQPLADKLVLPVSSQVHVLSSCDVIPFDYPQNSGYVQGAFSPRECWPLMRRTDGSLGTFGQRVRPGEVVSLYAFGLGRGAFRATGQPSPADAPVNSVDFDFEYRTTGSVIIHRSEGSRSPYLLFSGLAPGWVGLYQLNVRIPPIPDGEAQNCGVDLPSNLTISVRESRTVRGSGAWPGLRRTANLCVATE